MKIPGRSKVKGTIKDDLIQKIQMTLKNRAVGMGSNSAIPNAKQCVLKTGERLTNLS